MAGTAPATPAASRPAPPPPRSRGRASLAAATRAARHPRVDDAAGFVLALVFWTWVALPFLKSGPTGVKNTLRAKFFNKAADGSWLP